MVDIQRRDGQNALDLTFQDGTKDSVNAVWACDGINSRCRKVMQGPVYHPSTYTGFVAFRGKVPAEKVVTAVGESFATEAICFIGVKGWHVLTFPIGSGTLTNIAAFAMEPDWKRKGREYKVREEEVLGYFPERNDKVDTLLHVRY